MNARTLATITITTTTVAAFAIAALLDKITAPAMGGIALSLCAMIITVFMQTEPQANQHAPQNRTERPRIAQPPETNP